MKKLILRTFILGIISFFAACDMYDNGILNDVSQSNPTTITLEATNITDSSAIVSGKINMEYWDYVAGNNNNYCGFFFSTDEDELTIYYDGGKGSLGVERKATDIAEEFSVTLSELKEAKTYYYRAFVCVNNVLYRLGEIKSFTTLETPEPEAPLAPNGAFSVGWGKFVSFSKGNLQYKPSSKEWRFALHQYDHIGYDNENISSTYAGWIDLFGWGTGNAPTSTSKTSDYSQFIDWGNNQIANEEAGLWRTLTTEEWNYVLYERDNAYALRGVAVVAGVNGLILLPDSWICPNEIAFTSGTGSSFSSVNNYTASKWSILESAGAIFLPAGGYRAVYTAYEVQTMGLYWTANGGEDDDGWGTERWDYADWIRFTSKNIVLRGLDLEGEDSGFGKRYPYYGCSVRLAKSL